MLPERSRKGESAKTRRIRNRPDEPRRPKLGKMLTNALDVHRSALDRLEPILRVYEGCARASLGEVDVRVEKSCVHAISLNRGSDRHE